LKHENILPFEGLYNESSSFPPLTIVPYVEGGSLDKFFTTGNSLDAKKVETILLGITKGICYLHSLHPPVVHGDLHPGNVLLGGNSKPLLCDFGLSRIIHEVTRTRTRRQTGGVTRFLAPELTDCPEADFRTSQQSDVFSLAMLSLYTWSGKRPFVELEHEWKVSAALSMGQRPRQPTDPLIHAYLPQGMGAAFWSQLEKMWAQDPAHRPASQMVLECFEKLFAGEAPVITLRSQRWQKFRRHLKPLAT
ncbi:kinase-like protein, partial [Clavulina sp. PMI_390]